MEEGVPPPEGHGVIRLDKCAGFSGVSTEMGVS